MDEPVTAQYELTLGEAARAQARLLLGSRWAQALVVLGLPGAARFALTLVTGPLLGGGIVARFVTAGLDVFAVTLLVLLALGPLLVMRHATRMRDAMRAHAPLTLRLDPEGYDAEATGRVAWRKLEGATEAWGVLILMVTRERVLVVPLRALEGREARVRGWLRAALGARAKLKA